MNKKTIIITSVTVVAIIIIVSLIIVFTTNSSSGSNITTTHLPLTRRPITTTRRPIPGTTTIKPVRYGCGETDLTQYQCVEKEGGTMGKGDCVENCQNLPRLSAVLTNPTILQQLAVSPKFTQYRIYFLVAPNFKVYNLEFNNDPSAQSSFVNFMAPGPVSYGDFTESIINFIYNWRTSMENSQGTGVISNNKGYPLGVWYSGDPSIPKEHYLRFDENGQFDFGHGSNFNHDKVSVKSYNNDTYGNISIALIGG